MTKFEKYYIDAYGVKGEQWLHNLPELINKISATYNLSSMKPMHNLTYNYVLAGYQAEKPIILKLSLDETSLQQEALALSAFAEHGVIKLLAQGHGFILQECAIPGKSLKTLYPSEENETINITAHLMQQLHTAPIPHNNSFASVKALLLNLDNNDLCIPFKYLQKARNLRDMLLATKREDKLLHGDLHHDNILQNNDSWVAIDPKGIIGEACYETIAFIRNPIPELLENSKVQDIINNRITKFAEILNETTERLTAWCYVQAVLSWIFALEDKVDDNYFKRLTEFFFIEFSKFE